VIRSAALGGVFIGVLSALPIVNFGNCCCCLWVVSGGALASYLEVQQKNRTVTGGEGAAIGALAGVVGAFVWLVLALVLAVVLGPIQRAFLEQFLTNAREMPPEVREFFENMREGGGAFSYVLNFFLHMTVGTVMAAVGGLLSAAYFKKEVPPAMGGNWVPPLPPE
jgi:hypothetical protein